MEEIDLIQIIKILIKRKRTIVFVTLAVLVLSLLAYFVLPPQKEVYTILEIGGIGDQILEEPLQLKEKIEKGVFKDEIEARLNIQSVPFVEAEYPQNTKILVLKIKTRDENLGKKIVQTLGNIVLEKHKEILERKKKFLERKIDRERKKINVLEKSEKFPELQYIYLEHLARVDELEQKLETAKETNFSSPAVRIIRFRLLSVTVVAVFFGLILSFVFVLGQEFWEKNKKRLKL